MGVRGNGSEDSRHADGSVNMAKDDYHVIAYGILAYLYACLKKGEAVSLEFLNSDTFKVNDSYWEYILIHLYEDGYIEGAAIIPVLGKQLRSIKLRPDLMITPKGIEYLQENSMMRKAKDVAKGIIPDLIMRFI